VLVIDPQIFHRKNPWLPSFTSSSTATRFRPAAVKLDNEDEQDSESAALGSRVLKELLDKRQCRTGKPLVRLRGSVFSTMMTSSLRRKENAPEDEDRDHQG
jgi:hypothetical protein